jgi:hypothetical protein
MGNKQTKKKDWEGGGGRVGKEAGGRGQREKEGNPALHQNNYEKNGHKVGSPREKIGWVALKAAQFSAGARAIVIAAR